MNNFDAVIDCGSQNLRLGVFDRTLKNIYSSEKKITDTLEKTLNIIIKDAEKNLSTHIENVIVLFDSSKFFSLDFSIKKVFDHPTSIKKIYHNLIDEAQFFVSQNNFRDEIIHLDVNNILVDDKKEIYKITNDIKIRSLVLEIKFICINKVLIETISNQFKKNNLKILNLYCTSYVKSIFYKKKFDNKDHITLVDIGFERTSSLVFRNSKLVSFKSIPLGNNNITKDISKVLNLDLGYSEDLKIQFNKNENENPFNKAKINSLNPYSEILEKKISIDLLKKIIGARVDEIIELVVSQSDYIKNIDIIVKPKLIIIGRGSTLLSSNYNLSIKNFFSELSNYDEMDSNVCKAGLDYHLSVDSSLPKEKKKEKKMGFFETFFNLFSK